MGQYDVLEFLEKHRDKWFETKEIAKKMRHSRGSVANALCKLRGSYLVDFEVRGYRRSMSYRYKWKGDVDG